MKIVLIAFAMIVPYLIFFKVFSILSISAIDNVVIGFSLAFWTIPSTHLIAGLYGIFHFLNSGAKSSNQSTFTVNGLLKLE
jgi:hypothetical protein